MPWIDVSWPIEPGRTPLWPGSPEVRFEPRLRLAKGDPANDTTLHFGLHTGTHIDAPWHFLPDGAHSHEIDLGHLCGDCLVIDLRGHRRVTIAALEECGVPAGTRRLLLRTDNSGHQDPAFDPTFVGLREETAAWLAERGLWLLGIDYLSVQAYDADDRVHQLLLGAKVVLLEGLRLGDVPPGPYELCCAPLALVGLEGAPARALLRPLIGPTP